MRRAKWGIGAAAVVGLAWLISNWFPMNIGGIGSDDAANIGLPSVSSSGNGDSSKSPPLQSEPIPEDETVSLGGEKSEIGSGGAVEVLVDGRDYFLRRGTGEKAQWVAAQPDVIVSYARQAKGDETGVRVRVFRRPSALASAEDELAERLRSAGLKSSEVDFQEQLLKEN
jgi:hypothetical protein